jgi:thiol-disulfide isomerase/thioredoxin
MPPAAEPAAASQPIEALAAAPACNSALSFKAYGGRDIAIEDYKGKVVLVLFFSTDCPHCQTTARIMAPIYREYRAKGVEFLGLAVNPSAAQNLPAFVAQYGVEFPVGLGSSMQWSSFAKFSVTKRAYVPHVLFVGKDGQVVEDHPGEDAEFWQDQATNIAASLDRLLAQ